MSEQVTSDGRSRERSRSRERVTSREHERHSQRRSSHKYHSRDRKPHSRSRSHSPHSRSHSQKRHRDADRERHSGHKKHKRERDDKDERTHKHSTRRRRSRSPSASSISSASLFVDPVAGHGSQSTQSPPAFPSASALQTARSILAALLALDPASHDDLLFLLFQLDRHHAVIVQHIAHAEARQYLQRLVHVLALQRTTEEGGEEGWKVWAEWGDRKLLPELETVFAAARRGESKQATAIEELNASSETPVEMREKVDRIHPTALIGPALPPPSYRPPTNGEQQLPLAIDAQTEPYDEADAAEADYGPRLVSQLTADETNALEHVRQARQHLNDTRQHIQHLRSTTTAPLAHEEWMTAVPDAMSGQAALMASMTGDRAMKGRSFAMRDGGSGGDRDSSAWSAGPEEREWRRTERDAEKAVEKALALLRSVQQRVHNPPTSSSFAPSVARTTAASSTASSAEPSLLEVHRQRLAAEQSNVVRERGAPIMWDREKEMGMRRHKTDTQIAGELRGASNLSSRFAMGT